MIIEGIDYRRFLVRLRKIWAGSFFIVVAFLLGSVVGGINVESRIIGDCKFAGAFRVEIQAFTCQRRI